MKKYWKFNLHLSQEQLRNVRVSQFSSCFSWDDWFCESYISYTRINYTCFQSWKHSPQHSILWFCNIRAVKKKISIFDMYIPCEASSELSSTKTGSYPHEFLCRTNCSACADYQPWQYQYLNFLVNMPIVFHVIIKYSICSDRHKMQIQCFRCTWML